MNIMHAQNKFNVFIKWLICAKVSVHNTAWKYFGMIKITYKAQGI